MLNTTLATAQEAFLEMDAQEAQDFFASCAAHYLENAERLDNMDARYIAAMLRGVANALQARTGN